MEERALPREGTIVSRLLGSGVLRIMGWRIRGEFPEVSKCVAIAAPHTSNWDFIVGMAAKLKLNLSASWLGKHTIFFWPLGILLKWLGGIPVDRASARGVVDGVAELFRRRKAMILALSPEGTRKRVEKWKTGFYRIALTAGVPIVLVSLDYATRTVEIGPLMNPSGDLAKDLQEIGKYFSASRGRYPDQFSLPRLEVGDFQEPD
ncbi:MAG TPA: lysophospholipid acyltransferase family protein [Acidobacteriota bacterium]|nr:lysophospholipid acyltransferase family protein [Acidobacteriota bacterium]